MADLPSVPRRFHALLAPDERERASRLLGERSQDRWAASRAVLRDLLGRATGVDPATLRFELGPHGKPQLRRSSKQQPHFNISHSGDLAIYALSFESEVGVDVEVLDAARSAARDEVAIARRMLGAKVAEGLLSLEPDRRAREFLRAWVRHEALVKCLGYGLAEATRCLIPEEASGSGSTLWVTPLDVGQSACAALAAQGARGEVELNSWRPLPEG